ncbi:MAG TPA: TetR/AcrR family transcriptional regulator [Streptosporangiaceae bacterium]
MNGDVARGSVREPVHSSARGPREDRRSEKSRQAILNAADDLLVEVGYAAVTIEGIAARAGVGKQTIYRWWGSKADVLMDNYTSDAQEQLTPVQTGQIDAELREYLRKLVEFLTTDPAGMVLTSLIGQAQHDKEMAAVFRRDHLSAQLNWERDMLRRGIERGQLPADLDLDRALAELFGPVYYRVLVTGEPVDADFTDWLVERFIASHS